MNFENINDLSLNISDFKHRYLNSNETIESGHLFKCTPLCETDLYCDEINFYFEGDLRTGNKLFSESNLYDKIGVAEYFNVDSFKKPILIIHNNNLGNIALLSFNSKNKNPIYKNKLIPEEIFKEKINYYYCRYFKNLTKSNNINKENFKIFKEKVILILSGKISKKFDIIEEKEYNSYYLMKISFNNNNYNFIKKLKKMLRGVNYRCNWYKKTKSFPFLYFFLNGENLLNNKQFNDSNEMLHFIFDKIYDKKLRSTSNNLFEIFCTKYKNDFSHKEIFYMEKF